MRHIRGTARVLSIAVMGLIAMVGPETSRCSRTSPITVQIAEEARKRGIEMLVTWSSAQGCEGREWGGRVGPPRRGEPR